MFLSFLVSWKTTILNVERKARYKNGPVAHLTVEFLFINCGTQVSLLIWDGFS